MKTMMSILTLVGLGTLAPPQGSATVDTLWTRTYPYTTAEGGSSVQQTLDGGFIVATRTEEGVLLVKTDAAGDVSWSKIYDLGPHLSSSASIQQIRDGGYVLCGGFCFHDACGQGLLMRLDATGDSLWTKQIGGVNACVQQTLDDGFIMAGWAFVDAAEYRAVLTKTDANGDLEWSVDSWSSKLTSLQHVVELRDGSGYAAAGWSAGDVYFLKTDLDGVELESRTYGDANEDDHGSEIHEVSAGGFIICGRSGTDAYLVRADAIGDTLWTRRYRNDSDGRATAHSVVETPSHGFLAVGQGCLSRVWILETDAAGDTLWSRPYDIFPDEEYGRRVRSTSDGGYIIAGGGKSDPDHPYSLFVMRLGESVTDVASCDAVTSSAVHLRPSVPNPFNRTTTIRYRVPESGDVSLRVHDPMGRVVRTLVSGRRPAGTYSISWDGTNEASARVASGVYFYRILVNGEHQTGRMVLMQ